MLHKKNGLLFFLESKNSVGEIPTLDARNAVLTKESNSSELFIELCTI